jgi:hypothetical protein
MVVSPVELQKVHSMYVHGPGNAIAEAAIGLSRDP